MAVTMIESLRAFEADHVWVADNRERLLQDHADSWIAVRDGSVIGVDQDFDALLRKIPDPSHTCIEFIGREPIEMIL